MHDQDMNILVCGVLAVLAAAIVFWAVQRKTDKGPSKTSRAGAGTGTITSATTVKAGTLPKLDIATAYTPSRERFGVFKLFQLKRGLVTLTLSTHLAGAIYKFSYAGVEFVNPVPIVGASMQSTAAMDIPPGGSAELRNPTEAGCGKLDSFTGKSSSEMLELRASKDAVYTSTRAAYFRKPGDTVQGRTVLNTTVVSDVVMRKMLAFVDDQTLDYRVEQVFPRGKYTRVIMAVVACWVPWGSCKDVFVLDKSGTWRVAQHGTRYVDAKAIAVSNGAKAMGVACLAAPKTGTRHFKLTGVKQGNWKSWMHVNTASNPSGALTWNHLIRFGTPDDVQAFLSRATK